MRHQSLPGVSHATLPLTNTNTPNTTTPDPFTLNRDTGQAYWFFDTLWVILADSYQTGGAFCVIEQWMREGSGPPPHMHPCDEWFYVFDGTMDMRVGGNALRAQAGDSVWVPRGTDHSFKVIDGDAHALNGYMPGGIEQVMVGLGTPAEQRELPPADFEAPGVEQLIQFMSNYWSSLTDSGWATTPPVR